MSSRKLIDQLFRSGQSFDVPQFAVRYQFTDLPDDVPCQVAVSIPKRNFKSAVKRNRIKRVIKEAYRTNKGGLLKALEERGKQLALFLIFTGREPIQNEEAEEKIILILQRLENNLKD